MSQDSLAPLPIAFAPLARPGHLLGFVATILGERSPHVVALLELALLIATDVALVASGID